MKRFAKAETLWDARLREITDALDTIEGYALFHCDDEAVPGDDSPEDAIAYNNAMILLELAAIRKVIHSIQETTCLQP